VGAERPETEGSGTERPTDAARLLRDANERLVLTALRTQELLEAAEAFRLLIESVEDYAIFMLDCDGRVAQWNVSAERLYGYSTQEIVGQPFSILGYATSGEGDSNARDLERAREDGRQVTEGMRSRKDGSTFWATVIIAALRDEQGRAMGFATATRDLTERLRAEQEHVRLVRVQESERRKDEFLAIMGHELRNPLAPMVSALELIKLRGGRHCEREFAVIDRQLQHMRHLVGDLLDVARALRGEIRLTPTVVEVGEVVANALERALPLIEAKNHRLTVQAPARGLLVNVDPERMSQVFGNLLSNAARYTNPGGEIRVAAARRSDQIEVTIEDTGIGIAPELMPRIFELFAQGEQGMDRQHGGLGIGLAIVRRMVDEHGGRVEAVSEGVGRGSRFIVRLPRVEGEAISQAPPASSMPPPDVVPKRVLVVDDNEDASAMLSALLAAFGHETRVAVDGLHALEIAHEFEPDIVLLDIGLPGLDGFHVARRLRKIPGCEQIPIVAITGYAAESDRERALRSGFSDHMAKPVDLDALKRAVEMAPGR
jgi:PAS domain S-box-containing protein